MSNHPDPVYLPGDLVLCGQLWPVSGQINDNNVFAHELGFRYPCVVITVSEFRNSYDPSNINREAFVVSSCDGLVGWVVFPQINPL